MIIRRTPAGITTLLLCALAVSIALGQTRPQRDSLGFLKRSITEANAPALTAQQETALTDMIKAFREAQPQGPDAALEAARTAYDNALLAGDLATANAQATILANRSAALSNARLQAEAKFKIDALATLKTGGQFEPLSQKYGSDRVLGLVGSLAGGPGGGRPERGPGFGPGPGFGTGFGRTRPAGDGN